MAQLTRNSYFKNLLADEVFTGDPFRIEADYNTLKVSVQTDVSGTLSIFQSIDGLTYQTYNDVFAVNQTTHKQVHIKGKYVYVKYENGEDATSNFALYSVLSKTTAAATGVGLQEVLVTNDFLDVSGAVSVNGLLFDASGNLKVSGISGGGMSSDVTVLNQITGFSTEAKQDDTITAIQQQTTDLLFDLDIIANNGTDASSNAIAGNLKLDEIHTRLHDISGSVSLNNQITGFATESKQDDTITAIQQQTTDLLFDLDIIANNGTDASSNAIAANLKLDEIHTRLHDISGSVSLNNQITGFATETTLSTLSNTAQDISDHLEVPQRSWIEADFDTQSASVVQGPGTWRVPLTGEKGWEYVNTSIGGATLYFYSNTALVAGGLESDITLGSLNTMWFIGNYRLATAVNPNRRFYLSVYTKPQGAGDYEVWYRSSKTWQLPNTAIVSKGADVFFHAGADIADIYKEYEHTAYELAVTRGPAASNEIIQFMALQVDSATPANQFDGIVKHAGFKTATDTRNITFTRDSREKIATDNLKALTVTSNQLQVKDVSANSQLTTITELLGDTLLTVNYGLLNDTPTYAPVRVDASGALLVKVNNPSSGGSQVDISGASFTDGKLNVYDASSDLLLTGIKAQTDNLSFVDKGTYKNLKVDVDSFPLQQDVNIVNCTVTDGKIPVFDSSANSQLEKLSFYADMYGAFDLRTQVMNEVGVSVNNTPTVSLSAGTEVALASGTQVGLAAGAQVQLVSSEVSLASGTTVAITTATALDVDIQNTSLDTHIYGSHDGNTWHHILTTPQGKLVVNSSTQDGNGTNITSTVVGTATGLDVCTKGVTSVGSRDASNQAIAVDELVTAPVVIGGAADTQGYLWITAMLQFSSVTGAGSLYLEYSGDGGSWFRGNTSSETVFVNTSVTTTRVLIRPQFPCSTRYVRIYADTGFAATNAYAWVSMK